MALLLSDAATESPWIVKGAVRFAFRLTEIHCRSTHTLFPSTSCGILTAPSHRALPQQEH